MANERGKDLNEDPITGEPGSHPVGTGLGAAGGAAAGAALGTAVGGPIGTVVGGIIGAVTGGLAGKDVAENLDPTAGGEPPEHKVATGVGATGGALTGAAMGSIAGPLGTAAGAAIGAVAGGMAGRGVGEVVNPKAADELDEHNLASGTGAGADAAGGTAGSN